MVWHCHRSAGPVTIGRSCAGRPRWLDLQRQANENRPVSWSQDLPLKAVQASVPSRPNSGFPAISRLESSGTRIADAAPLVSPFEFGRKTPADKGAEGGGQAGSGVESGRQHVVVPEEVEACGKKGVSVNVDVEAATVPRLSDKGGREAKQCDRDDARSTNVQGFFCSEVPFTGKRWPELPPYTAECHCEPSAAATRSVRSPPRCCTFHSDSWILPLLILLRMWAMYLTVSVLVTLSLG